MPPRQSPEARARDIARVQALRAARDQAWQQAEEAKEAADVIMWQAAAAELDTGTLLEDLATGLGFKRDHAAKRTKPWRAQPEPTKSEATQKACEILGAHYPAAVFNEYGATVTAGFLAEDLGTPGTVRIRHRAHLIGANGEFTDFEQEERDHVAAYARLLAEAGWTTRDTSSRDRLTLHACQGDWPKPRRTAPKPKE